MKKNLLIAALAIASIQANAQTSFGVQAGSNFASIAFKEGTEKENSKTKVGLAVGLIADIDFGNSISFRPELNFIQKGGELKSTETNQGFTSKSEIEQVYNYIQLAPNFVYNFEAGNGKAFIGVGPEIAYGISGKAKFKSTVTGPGINETQEGEMKIKFDGKEDSNDDKQHLKALDYGANILAGYKFANNLYISGGYTLGLANIVPGGDNEEYAKNRGFNIKIGFLFGGSGSDD